MADKLSTETIAIVASNLTAALFATGKQRVDESDLRGSILSVYWDFCAELEDEKERDRIAEG